MMTACGLSVIRICCEYWIDSGLAEVVATYRFPLVSRTTWEMPTLEIRHRTFPVRTSNAVSTPLSNTYRLPASSKQGALPRSPP